MRRVIVRADITGFYATDIHDKGIIQGDVFLRPSV